ncbi:MBL fold metallo-hydrolase [Pseudonocardia xinjiangensis]|uniref:MBL fold metallo-hydrolase n=1 Tax=Pseudonocardia xinjiangensis TaxID=75289 RepID=A0ABX1RB74_9PSEU|nr:MBL fold metallo-hydrolase [Pseudonocardia xinjiangensis]NMH76889.1 MBL fold metallo-hydrolase [Pseudonocardia xinjiangensis]
MNETYEVVELVQGFPGRSTRHGVLGWSSVTLLRGTDRLVLVDSGSFGMRAVLAQRLAEHGVEPGDVTDVLLSHTHHDHAANYLLFPGAAVHVGAAELAWAQAVGPAFGPVPELYVKDLATNPRTRPIETGPDARCRVVPGITAVAAPGHTPGSLVFLVEGTAGPVLFTGDAAKNRAELLSGDVDMTTDRDASRRTLALITALWRERPGAVVVPGHDVPLVWPEGRDHPEYLGVREAGIQAWFGDDLATTHDVDLTPTRRVGDTGGADWPRRPKE